MHASRKRRRNDNGGYYAGGLDEDAEPDVDVQIFSNTATVSIDTHRNNSVPAAAKSLVKPTNEVFLGNSYVQSRRIVADKEGDNSSNIIAQVNAMSGCRRFRYFGDYGVDGEYGFHSGNNLILMRILVENSVAGDYRVLDMFTKLPEGLSFCTPDALAEKNRLKAYIDDVFDGSWYYCWNIYQNGGNAIGLPGESVWYQNGTFPINCKITGDQRLLIFVNTGSLTAGYTVKFRLLDHPNSICSRGAIISGAGYANTVETREELYNCYDDRLLSPVSFSDIALDITDYIDAATGEVDEPTYNAAVAATGFSGSYYLFPREASLVDSRYTIVNCPEVTFDSKTGILTNTRSISFTTVGTQLKDYAQSRFREHGEEPGEDYVLTNPITNLSQTCSTMTLQVERYNEYGEAITPGLVPYAYPDSIRVAEWVPIPAYPHGGIVDLFSRNIRQNSRAVFSDNPTVPLKTSVDTEYVDNGVRTNTSERPIHFGLNYMI